MQNAQGNIPVSYKDKKRRRKGYHITAQKSCAKQQQTFLQ
jgi:hypothetical protein